MDEIAWFIFACVYLLPVCGVLCLLEKVVSLSFVAVRQSKFMFFSSEFLHRPQASVFFLLKSKSSLIGVVEGVCWCDDENDE